MIYYWCNGKFSNKALFFFRLWLKFGFVSIPFWSLPDSVPILFWFHPDSVKSYINSNDGIECKHWEWVSIAESVYHWVMFASSGSSDVRLTATNSGINSGINSGTKLSTLWMIDAYIKYAPNNVLIDFFATNIWEQ